MIAVRAAVFACLGLAACGPAPRGGGDDGPGGDRDASTSGGDDANTSGDGNTTDGDGSTTDGDGGMTGVDASPDAPAGIITGGPCLSGSAGATAYRVRWAQAGSNAYVVYEVNGLPDHSRDKTGAYGYQIGFQPQFVDPFLGDGGLQLDSSDFVDIEITTAGVSQITSAKLAISTPRRAAATTGRPSSAPARPRPTS